MTSKDKVNALVEIGVALALAAGADVTQQGTPSNPLTGGQR